MAREHPPPRGGVSNQQVGRYQILNHIASGGMGAVYLAFDPVLNRNVALKVMSPDMAARPLMVQRFQREAKAAAKLKHENIVQIFDFGEATGTYYLALEFVDGTDLEDYIEQRPGGRLDVDEAIEVAIQAAKALDHAYSQDIVHRDIKPSNFLVTTRGGKLFIKLTDMGLAREADDSRITRDNTTLGTVEYISPEQARDSGSADTRSDLYSLGCSIFHMLVGHAPFPKGTLIEKVQHHLSTPAPDLRAHRSDVADHLANVLFKLLEKDPKDRYETPLHLLHDLMTPEDFKEYLKDTQELVRPLFKPPVHHKRTIAATVQLPRKELLPPLPLLSSSGLSTFGERTKIIVPSAKLAPLAAPQAIPKIETIAKTVVAPVSIVKETTSPPNKTAIKETQSQPPSENVTPATRVAPRDKSERATQPTGATKSKSEPRKQANGARTRRVSSAAKERLRRIEKRRLWKSPLWIGGIIGGLLFAAFGVWAVTLLFHRPRQPAIVIVDAFALEADPPVEAETKISDEPKANPAPVKRVDKPAIEPAPVELPMPDSNGKFGPETQGPKRLTKEPGKVNVTAVEREVAGPHGEFPKTPNEAIVLRVSRGGPPQPGSFPIFADAWREAGKRPNVILEIHDRGPIAIPSLPPLVASSLTIRAAAGVRPLLIWDKKPGDNAATWMPLERGSLILEGVDLLVRDDAAADEPAACFGVFAGDASAHHVNLMQVDSAKGGIALFRIAGREQAASRAHADSGQHARLDGCFLRGPGVMAACISAVHADVFFNRSLVVGQSQPTVIVVGQGSDIANIRALHSTLASATAIIHFLPSEGQTIAPRLGVFGLDSLFTNPGPDESGALLSVDESVGTSGLAAKITNSAFAGWPLLFRARQIRFATLDQWRTQWGHRDGDFVVPEHWPLIPDDDFDRLAALNCSPLDSAVAFASLKNDTLVGCPVGQLPPEPPAWRLLPAASLPAAVLDLPEAIAPAIDVVDDGLYHGEVLDLSKGVDLGAYLGSQMLAPRVVVHLVGRGTFRSSPLRVRDTHLVLAAPPLDGPTLEFQTLPGAAALLDFDKANLDLINVRIRLDWKKLVDVPKSVIRVQDGSVSLARCVVQTPLTKVPEAFDALITVQSSSADTPARLSARDCVFLSGAAFAILEGPAAQVRCNQSLILAMDDAVELKPGLIEGPPSAGLRFDYNTLVLDKAFLHVHPPAQPTGMLPPIPVHAISNYFSSPTPGGNALLLRAEGNTLASGLFAWHGQGNAFDISAFPHAVAWGPVFLPSPFPQAWTDLWGQSAEREAMPIHAKQPLPKLILEQPNLERFNLPSNLRLDPPGAHLQQLLPLVSPKKK